MLQNDFSDVKLCAKNFLSAFCGHYLNYAPA